MDSATNETQQIKDQKVVLPKQPTELTKEKQRKALKYIILLKYKLYGTIKGRVSIDGSKQR